MTKLSKITSGIVTGLTLALYSPALVFAKLTDPVEGGVSGGSLCPTGNTIAAKLCALGNSGTINAAGLAINIINIILFVAFALALIFLIVGGIRWIISGGDKAQTEAARNGVTSALIGLAVVVGAYVLVNVVLRLLGLTGGLSSIKDTPLQLF